MRKSSSVLIAPSQSLSAISAAAASYCALARTAEPAGATVPTRAKLAAASLVLAAGARALGLLVDRRRLALDQVGARRILLRRQLDRLGERLLGGGEGVLVERGVGDHGPGDAALRVGGRRLQLETRCATAPAWSISFSA